MADLIVGVIVAIMVAAASFYIYAAKKKGAKCIGCPDGCSCSGCCGCCGDKE